MDTNSTTDTIEQFELSPTQRFWGNIAAGGLVVCCGIFLLLCGFDVIGLRVADIILASVFYTIGLALLATGLIQKNTVSLWLAIAFITPATVEVMAKYSRFGYSNLYPFYIAIPAICSLFTMLFSREKLSHIYVVGFFLPLAIIFMLKSFWGVSWSIVLPVLIVFIGLMVLILAIMFKRASEGENE